jgi:hypothetical protein
MIEQNAVAGKNAIGLAIVHHDPVSIQFGAGIWRPWIKRGFFGLRNVLNQSIQFRCRGLVEADLFLQPQQANTLEQTHGAQCIHIRRILRGFKRNLDAALGGKVVDLIRLDLLDHRDEVG